MTDRNHIPGANIYEQLDYIIARLAEATWGSGQDPDESLADLTEWIDTRFRVHHETTLNTVRRMVENNTRLMHKQEAQP